MEAVAWHWLDDKTLMVLGDDMQWYRLENLYVSDIKFEGLDYSKTDSVTIKKSTYFGIAPELSTHQSSS